MIVYRLMFCVTAVALCEVTIRNNDNDNNNNNNNNFFLFFFFVLQDYKEQETYQIFFALLRLNNTIRYAEH